jgi:hypothetical protein
MKMFIVCIVLLLALLVVLGGCFLLAYGKEKGMGKFSKMMSFVSIGFGTIVFVSGLICALTCGSCGEGSCGSKNACATEQSCSKKSGKCSKEKQECTKGEKCSKAAVDGCCSKETGTCSHGEGAACCAKTEKSCCSKEAGKCDKDASSCSKGDKDACEKKIIKKEIIEIEK